MIQVVDAVSGVVSDTVIPAMHFFKEIDLFTFPRALRVTLGISDLSNSISRGRLEIHFASTKSISPNKQFNYS